MLLAAMVQAVQSKTAVGRRKAAELHAKALECLVLSTGTDHPNYQTIAGFLDLVAQFDGAVGAFAGANDTAASTTAASAGAGAAASPRRVKGGAGKKKGR